MSDTTTSMIARGWLLLVTALATASALESFRSGEVWYDTSGNVIDAHGGGFLLFNRTYYWYGSKRAGHPCEGATCDDGGINLYSSKDLYNWIFESTVVKASNVSESGNGLDLERPKMIHCAQTGKFVLWIRGTGKRTSNTTRATHL